MDGHLRLLRRTVGAIEYEVVVSLNSTPEENNVQGRTIRTKSGRHNVGDVSDYPCGVFDVCRCT